MVKAQITQTFAETPPLLLPITEGELPPCPYENGHTSQLNDGMLHRDPIAATALAGAIWVIF